MWLPVLLLAVMASGSACPDFCQCRAPMIECHGHAPNPDQLDHLYPDFKELQLHEIGQEELQAFAGRVRQSKFLQRMEVLEITNSSLDNHVNLPWYSVNNVIMQPTLLTLNVSHNQLTNLLTMQLMMPSMRVLDVSHNHIKNIAFRDGSNMRQLTWLNLAGNELDYIGPQNIKYFESLKYLDLSDNVLRTLEGIFDTARSLQQLNVAGNKLEHVQASWFKNLGKLVELDISRNKLTFIPADTLQPLTSLSVFKLAENPLIERDLSLLLGTGRRLEIVDASRIGLMRVPAALTRSVRTLKLAGNQLTSIDSGDLDSYPLLRLLDLSNNRLMIIEEDALGRLDNLEELILAGNILPTIPKSLPSGLKMFDLRQNAISKLKSDDLQGLYLLKELNLSGNVISAIEGGSFHQLPALEKLDISDNPIKKLPSDTLSGPTNLVTLRMSGLMSLKTEENQNQDATFPILTPERLVTLDISRSPALAAQLLADNAALSACKSLQELDLSYTNISAMRSDLAYVLPQLRKLNLIGNEWNCSSDQFWLGEWIRQHETSVKFSTRCSTPTEFEGKLLQELPGLPSSQIMTTLVVEIKTNTAASEIPKVEYTTTIQAIPSKPLFKKIKELENPMELSSTVKSIPNVYSTEVNSLSSTTTQKILSTSTLEPSFTTQSFLKNKSLQKENTKEGNQSHDLQTFKPATTIVNKVLLRLIALKNNLTVNSFKEHVSKIVNDKMTTVSPKSTTPVDLLKSNQDKVSTSTTFDNQYSLLTTRDDNNLKEDILTISSTFHDAETTTTTNTPSVLSSVSTETNTDSTTNLSEILSLTKLKQPAIIQIEEDAINKYKDVEDEGTIYNKNSANRVISEFSRSKLLFTNEEPRINEEPSGFAEELNSQATESGARTSESLASGAHPGMLVLLGAAIGAAAALTVVLSRRATVKRKDRQYQRHENIEVHALTPTTELW